LAALALTSADSPGLVARVTAHVGSPGGLVAVGCADPTPTGTLGGSRALSPSFAIGSEGAPPTEFNAQLRAETEIPTSTSESKGHSHFAVRADGVIESMLKINNEDEVVRFARVNHHFAL
jgi:hypothetical protein